MRLETTTSVVTESGGKLTFRLDGDEIVIGIDASQGDMARLSEDDVRALLKEFPRKARTPRKAGGATKNKRNGTPATAVA